MGITIQILGKLQADQNREAVLRGDVHFQLPELSMAKAKIAKWLFAKEVNFILPVSSNPDWIGFKRPKHIVLVDGKRPGLLRRIILVFAMLIIRIKNEPAERFILTGGVRHCRL